MLKQILELVNKETVSLVLIVSLFLYALIRITRGFNQLVENHMSRCNESLQRNTDVVAKNTTATARVADALNQIVLRMPNYGCSRIMNNSQLNNDAKECNEEVNLHGC